MRGQSWPLIFFFTPKKTGGRTMIKKCKKKRHAVKRIAQ